MKNELRELNKNYQENIKDSKLKYDIKMILRKYFKSALQCYEIGTTEDNNIIYEKDKKKIKYLLLEDKDGIIDEKIIPILFNELPYKNIDELLDLVDDFYVEELNKTYRYYQELDKARVDELEDIIYKNMVYSLKHSNIATTDAINQIRNINYKKQLKTRLKDMNIPINTYDKSYEKAFTRFKRDYKNYINENYKDTSTDDKISFGWRLYATTKVIEGLFKM